MYVNLCLGTIVELEKQSKETKGGSDRGRDASKARNIGSEKEPTRNSICDRGKMDRQKSRERIQTRYDSYDDDDNIVFEDFARLRLNEPE